MSGVRWHPMFLLSRRGFPRWSGGAVAVGLLSAWQVLSESRVAAHFARLIRT
jgi:hypothetical protein